MTITISTSQLKRSVSNVKKICDKIGIRLGKDEKNAQAIVLSILELPNWHTAKAKSDIAFDDNPMLIYKNIATVIKANVNYQTLDDSALIKNIVEAIHEDSFINITGSLREYLNVLDVTIPHLLQPLANILPARLPETYAAISSISMFITMIGEIPAEYLPASCKVIQERCAITLSEYK